MHSTFRYDGASRKYFNPMHGDGAVGFNGGKHSLIDPQDGHMYIGSPFIIGHGDYTSADFAILSNVVSITLPTISHARASNKRYSHDEYIPEV